jgi:tetratricopeptide (TPR) repeat protein
MYFLGRKQEAIDYLRSNWEKMGQHPRNSYWFSRLLAREEQDLPRAVNVARQALFNVPGQLEPWCNLAYVYYQAAQLKLAAGEARNAARYFPNEPLPEFHQGMAMYMMDDPKGLDHLRRAIKLGLKGEFLDEAKEVLDQQ